MPFVKIVQELGLRLLPNPAVLQENWIQRPPRAAARPVTLQHVFRNMSKSKDLNPLILQLNQSGDRNTRRSSHVHVVKVFSNELSFCILCNKGKSFLLCTFSNTDWSVQINTRRIWQRITGSRKPPHSIQSGCFFFFPHLTVSYPFGWRGEAGRRKYRSLELPSAWCRRENTCSSWMWVYEERTSQCVKMRYQVIIPPLLPVCCSRADKLGFLVAWLGVVRLGLVREGWRVGWSRAHIYQSRTESARRPLPWMEMTIIFWW